MTCYTDVVSYVCAVMCIPFFVAKMILLFVPNALTMWLSLCNCDTGAVTTFMFSYVISWFLNFVQKYWVLFWSALLYPGLSCKNYYDNYQIINFFRENVTKGSIKYKQIGQNIRNACEKEGGCEVYMKTMMMWAFLPIYRQCFLNNPLLFKYDLRLTNQSTTPFTNTDDMYKRFYSYVNKLNHDVIKNGIDNVGFTPNYGMDVGDNVIDYNNLGMQVTGKYTTLIYLDFNAKNPTELKNMVDKMLTQHSIMHAAHPIYTKVNGLANVTRNEFIPFSNNRRNVIIDLVVEYDDDYHVVTGKVEANIANGNMVEHPMLCLTHTGQVMQFTWNVIEELFTKNVMGHLESKA